MPTEPHLYDQLDAVATDTYTHCPECRASRKELAELALVFGVLMFGLGGIAGWALAICLRS